MCPKSKLTSLQYRGVLLANQVPLLELKNLSHGFQGKSVFENFCLQVEQGDSLVLVGPSGSGKSLLLKFFAGLVTPQEGQVLFQGEDLSTLSKIKTHSFLSQVGMLFQQNALFDSMTVYNNLSFVLRQVHPQELDSERHKKIQHYLEAVGLDHVTALFPSELSGGMQKRLGIARALVLNPKIVFYDDPTAGLDPITSRQIIQMILELKKNLDATIVTVTHDMMRAYQLAGRLMVCFHQDFVVTGSAEETKNHSSPKVQQFIHGHVQGPLAAL